MTFVLKLAPDLVTTAPSVRTQVDCLYEVPDVGRHGALVQVSELTGVSVRVVDNKMLKERLDWRLEGSPSAMLFGLRGGVIVQLLEEGEIFFVPVTS